MSLSHKKISGLYTAIVTPLKVDGSLDIATLQKLVRFQLDSGAAGVVPIGGTGEYPAFSRAERKNIVAACVDAADNKPVIPGVLATGFQDAAEAGKDFASVGAAAIMAVTPYYAAGTQEGMRQYFNDLAAETKIPLMLYQIPRRTGVEIEPETIMQLADDQVAIGIKFSHYDLPKFIKTIKLAGKKMAVLSGEEPLVATHIALGAVGGVLASATIHPKIWLQIMALAQNGKLQEALELQDQIDPVVDSIFVETNPGPLKAYMELVGFPVGSVRKPLLPPASGTIEKLVKVASHAKAIQLA